MHHHRETLRRVATVDRDAGLASHGSPRSHQKEAEEVVAPPLGQVGKAFLRGDEEEEPQGGGEDDEDGDEEDDDMEDAEGGAEPDAARESDAKTEGQTATDAEKLGEHVATLETQLKANERESQEWKALFEAARVTGQDLKRELFEMKAVLRAKDEQHHEQQKQETEQKTALEEKDAQILELHKLLTQVHQQVQDAQHSFARHLLPPADPQPSQAPVVVQRPSIAASAAAAAQAAAPVAVQSAQPAASGVTLAINVQLDRLLGSVP